MSKLVWDSAAAVSPATAEELGVEEGDLLAIRAGDRAAEAPALNQPGMADGVVAVTLGHGRVAGGQIAVAAAGFNMAVLLGVEDPDTPHMAGGVSVDKGQGRYTLVRTQKDRSMHGRPLVLDGTLGEYRKDAHFVEHKRHLPEEADLYPPYEYPRFKWEMAIDLGACTGCNACITACQAENNIPVVGKEQCGHGREMHWLRLDRYEEGASENPTVHQQPMLCQHCDSAPCENVCPVNATSHSTEGLNEMTYNRCVGTRYCSNNCPYKVRRFNFMHWTKMDMNLRDPVQELAFNPQVTVRGVGVMEKCTFCVQRINEAKFAADNRGAPLEDGAIQTACQQACPAQAITFGDANDPNSRVSKLKQSGRTFRVLEELNVKPSVHYLARVRNPHPDTVDAREDEGGHHA